MDYSFSCSDHLPLYYEVNINAPPSLLAVNSKTNLKVKRNFEDETRVERFFDILSSALNEFLNFEFCVEPFLRMY